MGSLERRAADLKAIRIVGNSRPEIWEKRAPARFYDASLGDQRIPDEIVVWAEAMERALFDGAVPPGNLVIIGPPRTGKTTMAYAALHHLNDRFIGFVGHTGSSLAEVMKFMLLADTRFRDLQPMVLTSNLDLMTLENHYGERLLRRLVGDDATLVITEAAQ
jgi:DNA replication protein DnaC